MGLIFNREKKPAALNLVTEAPAETEEKPAAEQTTATTTPQATAQSEQTAGARMAGILGEDPAVTAARREAQRRGAEKKAAWLSVFDGLRYLGQAAGIGNSSAPAATYNNTADIYMQREKERQTAQTQAETAQRAYQKQLYDMAVQRYKEQRDEAERKEKNALRDKDEERKARTAELREEDARRKAEAHEVAMEGKKTENAIKEKKKENLESGKTEQGGDPNRRGSGNSGKETEGDKKRREQKELDDAWNALPDKLPDGSSKWHTDANGNRKVPDEATRRAQVAKHGKKAGSAGGGKKIHKTGKKIHRK